MSEQQRAAARSGLRMLEQEEAARRASRPSAMTNQTLEEIRAQAKRDVEPFITRRNREMRAGGESAVVVTPTVLPTALDDDLDDDLEAVGRRTREAK
jgi:hypothetical protein